MVFLLSCTTNSTPHKILSRRKTEKTDVTEIELKSLDVLDKSAIVKENLARHGKVLDESPFNNQVSLLLQTDSKFCTLLLVIIISYLYYIVLILSSLLSDETADWQEKCKQPTVPDVSM